MSQHPYKGAPDYRLWRRAMAGRNADQVDPAGGFAWRISPRDRVVTAGSCFAQHIAQHLRARGFNYVLTEPPHPSLMEAVAREFQYGVYSARWGNIYTARQLRQLFDRVFGRFCPVDDIWQQDGAYYDPYRPAIQPGGFASRAEFVADRVRHFTACREAFLGMEYFVFTLGLTEGWINRADGAVYPVCPGTVAGVFYPEQHLFHDFSVDEIVADFRGFLAGLRAVNAGVKVILTVSPVPLAATAKDMDVLQASVLSKSVLRVAAGILAGDEGVAYFPSYEIVTGPQAQNAFEADLRSVSEETVERVMRIFFRQVTDAGEVGPVVEAAPVVNAKTAMEVICEEERLGA